MARLSCDFTAFAVSFYLTASGVAPDNLMDGWDQGRDGSVDSDRTRSTFHSTISQLRLWAEGMFAQGTWLSQFIPLFLVNADLVILSRTVKNS